MRLIERVGVESGWSEKEKEREREGMCVCVCVHEWEQLMRLRQSHRMER